MKEIRTIKMVEQTEIKFVADDGKEFTGDNAERDCRDYERTRDRKKVEEAFERLDAKELNIPIVSWFGEYSFWRIVLNSKSDYVAMMDYFKVIRNIFDSYVEAPSEYPCTKIITESYDYLNEYEGNIKEELQNVIVQLDS